MGRPRASKVRGVLAHPVWVSVPWFFEVPRIGRTARCFEKASKPRLRREKGFQAFFLTRLGAGRRQEHVPCTGIGDLKCGDENVAFIHGIKESRSSHFEVSGSLCVFRRRNPPGFLPRVHRGRASVVRTAQLDPQVRSGVSPQAFCVSFGETESRGCFPHGHSAKEPEFYKPRRLGVSAGQAVESFIEGQHIDIRRNRELCTIQFIPVQRSTPLLTSPPPRPFDQNPPHRFGGGREEMHPVFPSLGLLGADQAEIRLVDESRGLERLPRFFLPQLRRRQLRSSS